MNAPGHPHRPPLTPDQTAIAILEILNSTASHEAIALRTRWVLEHEHTPARDQDRDPADLARRFKLYAADASEHAGLMKIDRARKDTLKGLAIGLALLDRLDHEARLRIAAEEPQETLPL